MYRRSARRLLTEHALEVATDEDAQRWARSTLDDASHSYDPELLLALGFQVVGRRTCSPEVRGLLAVAARTEDPEFEVSGSAGELLAQQVLEEQCRRLLDGYIGPWGVCKLVPAIESLFDFPGWLGEMYDHCDWCEPEHSAADWPHLIAYVRGFLSGRRARETDGLAGAARELGRRGLRLEEVREGDGLAFVAYGVDADERSAALGVRADRCVRLFGSGSHWEASVVGDSSSRWARGAVTLPDLVAVCLEALNTEQRPPSERWVRV